MCGITGGVWTVDAPPLRQSELDAMTDVLAHRGPDGRGTHREQHDAVGVALGHRRLSIIDLAGGSQPLANEDGSIWITFNGEIYNYRELREQLVAKGHQFRTAGDTETIVHLYEEYGVDCLAHLRGMFALAIWDRPRQRLFLARDRLGQKPLVYCRQPGRLLFASEIKSLLQADGVAREVDLEALDDYLAYLYVPHPHTMFRGIHKLPPAHYAVWERGELRIENYWKPDLARESTLSLAETQEALAATMRESVRLRLRSDVPLGAFLSGGIDSTAIVGLMQEQLDTAANTYTIGFPVDDYDESRFARQVAEHLGTSHHEFMSEAASVDLLPTLAWHFDEPFADSSAIPTYLVSQITRRHVKVALTGDGGDELFAGYPRYATVQRLGAWDDLPRWLRAAMFGGWWNRLPAPNREQSLLRRWQFRMGTLRQAPPQRYANWVTIMHNDLRRQLYNDQTREQLVGHDPSHSVAAAYRQSGRRERGVSAMHADLLTYLPDDLLTKVDVASMAHGLECRSPFLDHKVVELAAQIPYAYLTSGGGPKPLLTSTFPQFFPEAIRRRPKMGFRVPLDHWFRQTHADYVRDTLLSERAVSRGYFERTAIKRMLDEHRQGRWNHGDRLWALLCLETWHQTFLDASPSATASAAAILRPERVQALTANTTYSENGSNRT